MTLDEEQVVLYDCHITMPCGHGHSMSMTTGKDEFEAFKQYAAENDIDVDLENRISFIKELEIELRSCPKCKKQKTKINEA